MSLYYIMAVVQVIVSPAVWYEWPVLYVLTADYG